MDFPLGPGCGERGSIGVVTLDDGLEGGGGARDGRKVVDIGVGVGVDAREYKNCREACFLLRTGYGTYLSTSPGKTKARCQPAPIISKVDS